MQTNAQDRDDSQVAVVCHDSSPDDTGDQNNFDLWIDLGGSD